MLPDIAKGALPNAAPPLPADWMDLARSTTDRREWMGLKSLYRRQPNRSDEDAYHQALYSNPLAGQFDTETAGPRHGLWGRIKQTTRETPAFSSEGRTAMAKIAAFVALASAVGAMSGGAGAGGGSGGFVAGGGGGPALATPSSSIGRMGLFAKLLGGGGGGSAQGGGMDWGELIKLGVGTLGGSLLNKQQAPGKDLSRSPYESGDLQRYLPPELRSGTTGPLIGAGVQGIGELLRNPGGLSPVVLDAIRPRLAEESQSIAQNYRGLQANQAGVAARGNAPVSIKNALASALDVAQERAQRSARNEALTASDTMRRGDLEQVYQLLNAILAFQQAGRGTATAGIGAGTALQSQQNAAMMALLGSLLQPKQGG